MTIERYTTGQLENLPSETDNVRLATMTDSDLMAAAQLDPDNPPLTDEQLRQMKPIHEVLPWLAKKQPRGRPVKENTKVSLTIRLQPEIVDYFKAGGEGWQTRLNDALMRYISENQQAA